MALTFPGESAEYRAARKRLLAQEVELRHSIEAVAAARRALPPGGVVPHDYVFDEHARGGSRRVKMSELFAPDTRSLAVYSFMYGPQRERPCPMCTSMLDALDGAAQHITQRVNLVVVARSPIERIVAFGRERGWRWLRLLSAFGNTYSRDYHGESAEGGDASIMNVFTRDPEGVIRHSWASELGDEPPQPGQEPRALDVIDPIWNTFDLTPDGRGADWHPSLDRHGP